MKNKDADRFLAYLSDKKRRNEPLTDMDFAGLAMTPVMGSTKSKVQRIYEAASLICEDTSEAAHRVMAVLYAFAEKFMNDPMDLERLREGMRMTRLQLCML